MSLSTKPWASKAKFGKMNCRSKRLPEICVGELIFKKTYGIESNASTKLLPGWLVGTLNHECDLVLKSLAMTNLLKVS